MASNTDNLNTVLTTAFRGYDKAATAEYIAALQSGFEQEKQTMQGIIDSQGQELSTLKANAATMVSKYNALSDSLTAKETKMKEAAQSRINQIQADAKSTVDHLQMENAAYKKQIADLQSQCQSMTEKVRQFDDMQEKYRAATMSYKAEMEQMQKSVQEAKDLTATIHEKEKMYTDQIADISRALGVEKQSHAQDQQTSALEAKKLRDDVSRLSKLVENYKQELSSGELAKAHQALQEVKDSLEASESRNKILTDKCAKIDQMNSDLNTLVTALRKESDQKTEQLRQMAQSEALLQGQQQALTEELKRLYAEYLGFIAK